MYEILASLYRSIATVVMGNTQQETPSSVSTFTINASSDGRLHPTQVSPSSSLIVYSTDMLRHWLSTSLNIVYGVWTSTSKISGLIGMNITSIVTSSGPSTEAIMPSILESTNTGTEQTHSTPNSDTITSLGPHAIVVSPETSDISESLSPLLFTPTYFRAQEACKRAMNSTSQTHRSMSPLMLPSPALLAPHDAVSPLHLPLPAIPFSPSSDSNADGSNPSSDPPALVLRFSSLPGSSSYPVTSEPSSSSDYFFGSNPFPLNQPAPRNVNKKIATRDSKSDSDSEDSTDPPSTSSLILSLSSVDVPSIPSLKNANKWPETPLGTHPPPSAIGRVPFRRRISNVFTYASTSPLKVSKSSLSGASTSRFALLARIDMKGIGEPLGGHWLLPLTEGQKRDNRAAVAGF